MAMTGQFWPFMVTEAIPLSGSDACTFTEMEELLVQVPSFVGSTVTNGGVVSAPGAPKL